MTLTQTKWTRPIPTRHSNPHPRSHRRTTHSRRCSPPADAPNPPILAPLSKRAELAYPNAARFWLFRPSSSLVAVGAAYRYIVSGGMSARQTPSAVETYVAHWLVDLSIPNEVKGLKNPLSSSAGSTDVAAGRELYQKHCEVCHGYDGIGKTDAGVGLFPPPST